MSLCALKVHKAFLMTARSHENESLSSRLRIPSTREALPHKHSQTDVSLSGRYHKSDTYQQRLMNNGSEATETGEWNGKINKDKARKTRKLISCA